MILSTPVADPAQKYSAMSDNVLIIVGDATEAVDTLYLVLRLQKDGFESVVDEPEARRYNIVLHEILAECWDIPRKFEGYATQANIAFRDILPEEYASAERRMATEPKSSSTLSSAAAPSSTSPASATATGSTAAPGMTTANT